MTDPAVHSPAGEEPHPNDLTGPWGWGWRSVTVTQGQTVTFDVGGPGVEAAGITDWKMAALWTPSDLQNVPDVDFFVDNTCAFGGGTSTLLADTGYDVRTRFRLSGADIAGKCLRMRLYGYSVPPGGVNTTAGSG